MTAGAAGPGPTLATDPTTGRPILMAPQRQHRPMLTAPGRETRGCPFCPGHEHETPPEVDAWREHDGGDWSVRVFANKYPAAPVHEVIAEGARHTEEPADLDLATWTRVVQVWQRRITALEQRPDVAHAFLFKNVGLLAGASIAHSHSQLIGLAAPPPRVQLELARARALGTCPWCDAIAHATATGAVVVAGEAHVAIAPEPPKLPYETWILPRRCDDDFARTDAAGLAATLRDLLGAVRDRLARPAYNLWLHRMPDCSMHWHFELQPRTGHLAGLELGGDMYINSMPARTAAARLRGDEPPRAGP